MICLFGFVFGSDFGDTVDTDIEIRSCAESGFIKEGYAVFGLDAFVAFKAVGLIVAAEVLALYGELGAVKYLESSVLDSLDGFFNLFGGACCASLAELGCADSVLSIAFGPVGGKGLAFNHISEDGFVVKIVRDMDGYDDIKTDYISKELFDSCLRTGYLTEIKEKVAIGA